MQRERVSMCFLFVFFSKLKINYTSFFRALLAGRFQSLAGLKDDFRGQLWNLLWHPPKEWLCKIMWILIWIIYILYIYETYEKDAVVFWGSVFARKTTTKKNRGRTQVLGFPGDHWLNPITSNRCSTAQIHIWLVVTGSWLDYDFPFSWEFHHPNWLIFFRGVGKPPTRYCFSFVKYLDLPRWGRRGIYCPIRLRLSEYGRINSIAAGCTKTSPIARRQEAPMRIKEPGKKTTQVPWPQAMLLRV
jgi:hypothetical protein